MTPGVVIVAAGWGERLGAQGPKALVRLHGRALIAHAVAAVAAAGLPPPVVVHPAGFDAAFRAAVQDRVADWVVGGERRRASVRAGVRALDPGVDVVAIHDAARALTLPAVIRRVVAALEADDEVIAAAPAVPVADTLKRVRASEIIETVDRDGLFLAQTPQVMRRHAVTAVLDGDDGDTDELAPLERLIAAGVLSGRIVMVPGSGWGAKITHPEDLRVMSALARAQDAGATARLADRGEG